MAFVPLHVHSQYSLLDGQASVQALVDKAVADGMPGLALTDHGNMFGIKEFYNYVKKVNSKIDDPSKHFKPILGCEMYVADTTADTHVDKHDIGRHLIVLAKNRTGYKNLIKLVSDAWTAGFYMHPRTDKEQIARHHEGLIICSACLGGEVPRLLRLGDLEGADRAVKWWHDLMGDDYYLELQRHKATAVRANHETYELQMRIEPQIRQLAAKYGIKLVATNDTHFVNADDAEAHDRLICLSTNKFVADDNRMLYTKQEWLKTTAEMSQLFADIPEAVTNTAEILEKVEEYDIDHAPIMPTFAIPASFGSEDEYRSRITEQQLFDEFTRDENGNVVMAQEQAEAKIKKLGGYDRLYRIKFEADYLAKLAWEGAKQRYGDPLPDDIRDRIRFELHIMKTMGFPGYFLIVQDFINAARHDLGVSVGPGRGSAAGSCVAYCLGITQIDPIKYDLLFERFLNPDRISLPDIDIDFDDDGRAEVLRYVTDKYGAEKVAHIITYGTMASKSAIKDVARVEQLPLAESLRLAKLVPDRMPTGPHGEELKDTLANCFKYVPDLRRETESSDPLIRETLQYAGKLEGNVRNTGVHACGVIICRDDVTDWVPVSTATDKTDGRVLVTQYEGRVIEETGLIKMDFLGLKTLSILKEAVANIKDTRGIDLDLDHVPIDDPKTYKLYAQGRTVGTFQFESAGMQKYLRELRPSTFEDLIAMNALYRPGPMDYIPDFIRRKHGESPIVYDIPEMEKYLKDTYGVTVYQEQVMLLSRLLANFTRGESDTLRKAMGKKLKDKMAHLKGKFLEGGQANGHDPAVLEKIWADWEKFASYAFNKSHATCYSWIAFQTAYLKANYPSEYMAAVLSRNLTDLGKLANFMDECRAMHISVLGPDVNESFANFGVNKHGDIRFGLSAIKGVGAGVAAEIIAARREGGRPFTDIYDFVERLKPGVMNRRTFESLATAGAFDCFEGIKREDFFVENAKGENLAEQLLRYAQRYRQNQTEAQASLFSFDDFGADLDAQARPPIKPAPAWPDIERLTRERDLVGMFLSAHPLDPFFMELNYGTDTTIKGLKEMIPVEDMQVTFGGMVASYDTKPTKTGKTFGILKIEDETGSTELRLFGKAVFDFGRFGIPMTPVLVTCKWRRRFRDSNELDFEVVNIRPLSDVKGHLISGITVNLTADQATADTLAVLTEHINTEHTDLGSLALRVYDPAIDRTVRLTSSHRIAVNKKLVQTLQSLNLDFTIMHNA